MLKKNEPDLSDQERASGSRNWRARSRRMRAAIDSSGLSKGFQSVALQDRQQNPLRPRAEKPIAALVAHEFGL
jgi:hypothetical protein